MFCCKGEKSDDPQSPAYTPSLFGELKPQEERLANQKLKRYEAVKRREQQRDCLLTSTAEHTEIMTANSQPISNNMDSEQECQLHSPQFPPGQFLMKTNVNQKLIHRGQPPNIRWVEGIQIEKCLRKMTTLLPITQVSLIIQYY